MITPDTWVAVGVTAVRPSATVSPCNERAGALIKAQRWNMPGSCEADVWCTAERAVEEFKWCVARVEDLHSGDELEADTRELLHLLQEESAEVVQAASKCLRFGFHVNPFDGVDNRRSLENEVGDFVAAMVLLGPDGGLGGGIISLERVFERASAKIQALAAPDGRLRHYQVPAMPAEDDKSCP